MKALPESDQFPWAGMLKPIAPRAHRSGARSSLNASAHHLLLALKERVAR